MKTNAIFIFSFLVVLLASCSNNNQAKPNKKTIPEKTVQNPKKTDTPSVFAIDSIKIQWTGFKYSNKTGVNGTFDKIKWQGFQEASSPAKCIEKASFDIDVSSLNTGNPGRDKTIREYLFGKMMETNHIEGRITGIDEQNAAIKSVIRMNNTEVPVVFRYTDDGKAVTAVAHIDLVKDFKAGEPLYFLHTACEEKHRGKDGISKTWPDVDLKAVIFYHKK